MEEYKSLGKLAQSINKTPMNISNINGNKLCQNDKEITINIGGTIFQTLTSTTRSVPGSLLSKLDQNSKYFNQSTQTYHFDRDADKFKHILNAHREGEMHVPRDVCPVQFKKEIQFWQIPIRMLAPCCWKNFYESETDLQTLDHLAFYAKNSVAQVDTCAPNILNDNEMSNNNNTIQEGGKEVPVKQPSKLWLFLDEPSSSTAAKVWCFFYIFVVLLSTAVYLIWIHPSVRVVRYLNKLDNFQLSHLPLYSQILHINEKVGRLVLTDPHPVLFALDSFCTMFFITELILHFWSCPKKLQYFKCIHNDLKIFLSVSMVISYIYETRKDFFADNVNNGYIYFAFKSCNVLRLLLICQLRKLYTGLRIMLLSLRKSCKELLLLVVTFCMAVIVYGGLIFVCEIESEMFPTIFTSMWWALITMTTVGYGDFYPTEPAGYIAGAICAINGLIVIALPIAAIAANFSHFYSRSADMEKHLYAVTMSNKDKCETDEK